MYSIAGFVAERTVLERHFPSVPPAGIVDLDQPPFALLPLTGEIQSRIRIECEIDLEDFAFTDDRYLENVLAIVNHLATSPSEASMAYVAAEMFGGSGGAFGCAFTRGETKIFREAEDKWPNTNISLALKSIGVPEALEKGLDAFDFVGLGRHRSIDDWLPAQSE
jgi:hypothetical protein